MKYIWKYYCYALAVIIYQYADGDNFRANHLLFRLLRAQRGPREPDFLMFLLKRDMSMLFWLSQCANEICVSTTTERGTFGTKLQQRRSVKTRKRMGKTSEKSTSIPSRQQKDV